MLSLLDWTSHRVRLIVDLRSEVAIHIHWPITLVVISTSTVRAVNRDLSVISPETMAMGVRVREQASLEHLVLGGLNAWDGVGRGEGRLLDLCEVVLRVAVESEAPVLDERVVTLWPDLGNIEDIPLVVSSVLLRHDLHTCTP